MKRTLTIALGAAMLAVPVVAHGQGVTSVGHLDGAPDSTVKLKEALTDDGHSVKSFAVQNFEVACDDGTTAIVKRTKLSGTIPVSDGGDFKIADDNGKTTFKITGHIGANKASGGFRYFGSIPDEDGVKHDCDTGKLSWVTRP